MKIFEGEIKRHGKFGIATSADIAFPATATDIEEAFHIVRINPKKAEYYVRIFPTDWMLLDKHLEQISDVYELNFLAQRLDVLDEFQKCCFEGLVKMDEQQHDVIPLEHLINLTYNLDDVLFVPATNDKELGEFYADNDFIEELSNLPQSIYNKLDFAKIGNEMRETEKGVYIRGGYVVNNGEIKQKYTSGSYPKSLPPDYAFLLEITKAPIGNELNEQSTVTLKLPASTDNIVNALKQIGVSNLQECIFYRFESTIPSLSSCFENMDDFEKLNELAVKIKEIDSHGDLQKFKALLEATQCYELYSVCNLSQNIDRYDFNPEITSICDYAKSVLEKLDIPMKSQFFDTVDLTFYGAELMEQTNVYNTQYGFITAKDGGQIIRQEQEQSGMTMGI